MKLHVDPALKKALRVSAAELDALEADWALGGATAMQAHGYARATRDIDLFVGDDSRTELLAGLRKKGLPVRPIFPPLHYRVEPPARRDPEASIDFLFPALGIESLGLLAARRMLIDGILMPVVPLHHLVALKLASDPEIDPPRYLRDLADLIALRDRGLVDAPRVLTVLEDARDVGARARLMDLTGGRLYGKLAPEPAKRRQPRRK